MGEFTDQRLLGRVGPGRYADGMEAQVRLGSAGEQIVQDLNGRYYEQVVRGNVFLYNTAAIALITPAVTGNHPTLWNPAGSGYNFVPIRIMMGYVTGNNAPGSIQLSYTANAGAAIGTAAPIVTFTDVAAINALLGSSNVSRMRWAPAINTFIAVPAFLKTLGLSLFTGLAATAVAPFSLCYDFDGSLIVGPGNAISITAAMATTTATFLITLIGMELPIPMSA